MNSYRRRQSPLQRHYSDESLGGAYQTSPFRRIHSSADEISSLNHSPSISSSDESYSRTTDADVSPCISPPLTADAKQFLFPSDIQVNPCSPEVSPKASLDYILTEGRKEDLPPNTVLAIAANCSTVDSTRGISMNEGDSYRGDSCASFEFLTKSVTNNPKGMLLRTISANSENKPNNLEKRVRTDSDSIVECNKQSSFYKRSPSFNEVEEMRMLLKEDTSEKRENSCQTVNSKLKNNDVNIPFEREIQKILDEQNLLKTSHRRSSWSREIRISHWSLS